MPIDHAQDTVRVLTTELLAVDYVSLMHMLEARALQAGACAVNFSDTSVVALRHRNPAFARLTSCFDVFVPKSMTLVWGMNLLGAAMESPIDPSIFMRRLLYQSSPDFRHYFIGETEESSNRLRERILRRNPDIDVVGLVHGPCSESGCLQPPELHDFVLEDVRDKEPHFVWVGVDVAAQYALVANLKRKARLGVLLALGSAFDVNSGVQPEAPPFMLRHKLTWLYRLFTEPMHFLSTDVRYNALFLFDLLRSSGKADR